VTLLYGSHNEQTSNSLLNFLHRLLNQVLITTRKDVNPNTNIDIIRLHRLYHLVLIHMFEGH